MDTLKQIKEELPLINRIHLQTPTLPKVFGGRKKVIPVEIEKTTAYVLANTVVATDGRKCVDGRYTSDTASGMIARAGGDCGYVMALMAINKKKKLHLTPEQCFNAVYKVIKLDMNGTFCLHTDHHADPENRNANLKMHQTLIGCGHIAAASKRKIRSRYDVSNDDVKKMVLYVRNLADITRDVDMVNLQGEHREQGVLLIESNKFTVNAMDGKGKGMYFIYDKLRDEEFMRQLTKEMAIVGVSFEDMKKESDIQLQATLHNLAKGLPLYHVKYDGSTPEVKFLSKII